uniref:Uncharacterized protein n=1 Tax=Globodera rostochiensis TaxID=31243 RepID=A0A914H084_GLORO
MENQEINSRKNKKELEHEVLIRLPQVKRRRGCQILALRTQRSDVKCRGRMHTSLNDVHGVPGLSLFADGEDTSDLRACLTYCSSVGQHSNRASPPSTEQAIVGALQAKHPAVRRQLACSIYINMDKNGNESPQIKLYNTCRVLAVCPHDYVTGFLASSI